MVWADHLDYLSYVQEGIHLSVLGGKSPLDEFHRLAIAAFDDLLERVKSAVAETFETMDRVGQFDPVDVGLKTPSATWTYLISDDPGQFSNLAAVLKATAASFREPLFSLRTFYRKFGGGGREDNSPLS